MEIEKIIENFNNSITYDKGSYFVAIIKESEKHYILALDEFLGEIPTGVNTMWYSEKEKLKWIDMTLRNEIIPIYIEFQSAKIIYKREQGARK